MRLISCYYTKKDWYIGYRLSFIGAFFAKRGDYDRKDCNNYAYFSDNGIDGFQTQKRQAEGNKGFTAICLHLFNSLCGDDNKGCPSSVCTASVAGVDMLGSDSIVYHQRQTLYMDICSADT